MKHLSILVLHDITLPSLDISRTLFTRVNDFLKEKGEQPIFNIELVGLTKVTQTDGGLYSIRVDKLLQEVDETNLIIIPQVCGSFPAILDHNADFVPWITDKYKKGAEIASLCVGAFLLASTGLLKGRQCATHWATANEFRKMFPDVNLIDNKIITDEQGIYTSAGNFSYLNLILYLIEKFAGRKMCVFVSKMFEIEIERKTQAPFIIFMGQKDHGDELVTKAQEFIECNYRDKITIDQIASLLFVGRRNLERRFKKATSNSVIEYIQRVKVEAVKKGLETSRRSILELMQEVDYADTKSFRDIFKKITGLSPAEYKRKYNMALAS
ncbi:MAG: helix-turn-helix domain-containing protein [Bacteroidota bacterium]